MQLLGIIGLVLISLAIWQKEKRQDMLFILGGLALFVYSYHLGDTIFMILQIVFILSAALELSKLKKR